MKNLILILSFLIRTSTFAGGGSDVGNGGDVVACRDVQGELISVETLDLYEWRKTTGLSIRQFPTIDENLVFNQVAAGIGKFIPSLEKDFNSDKNFFDQNHIKAEGISLLDVPDSMHVVIPQTCLIEQIAIQKPPQLPWEKYYTINKTLWDKMDATNKAALVFHEIIFKRAIANSHQNSIAVRKLVGYIFSSLYESQKLVEFVKVLNTLKILPESDIREVIYGRFRMNVKLTDPNVIYDLETGRLRPGITVTLLPDHFLLDNNLIDQKFLSPRLQMPLGDQPSRVSRMMTLDQMREFVPRLVFPQEYFNKCIVNSPVPVKDEVITNPKFNVYVDISRDFVLEKISYDANNAPNYKDNYSIGIESVDEVLDICNNIRGFLKMQTDFSQEDLWRVELARAHADFELFVAQQFGPIYKFVSTNRDGGHFKISAKTMKPLLTNVIVETRKAVEFKFQDKPITLSPGAKFVSEIFSQIPSVENLQFIEGTIAQPGLFNVNLFGNEVPVPFKQARLVKPAIFNGHQAEIIEGVVGPVDASVGLLLQLTKKYSFRIFNEVKWGRLTGEGSASFQDVKLTSKNVIPFKHPYIPANEISVKDAVVKIFTPINASEVLPEHVQLISGKLAEPVRLSVDEKFGKMWNVSLNVDQEFKNGKLPTKFFVTGNSDFTVTTKAYSWNNAESKKSEFKYKSGYTAYIYTDEDTGPMEHLYIKMSAPLAQAAQAYCRIEYHFDSFFVSPEKMEAIYLIQNLKTLESRFDLWSLRFMVQRTGQEGSSAYQREPVKSFRNNEVRIFNSDCSRIPYIKAFPPITDVFPIY